MQHKTKRKSMSVALIILAAGQGSRMNSALPKVLHPIAGAPMLHHAIAAGNTIKPNHVIVVAGVGADQVTASAKSSTNKNSLIGIPVPQSVTSEC